MHCHCSWTDQKRCCRYWQCVPNNHSLNPPPAVTPAPLVQPSPSAPVPPTQPVDSPLGSCAKQAATWGQCGGKSNCPTGMSCVDAPWYVDSHLPDNSWHMCHPGAALTRRLGHVGSIILFSWCVLFWMVSPMLACLTHSCCTCAILQYRGWCSSGNRSILHASAWLSVQEVMGRMQCSAACSFWAKCCLHFQVQCMRFAVTLIVK